ncbi:MAG: hypothetical protein GY765_00820, partial [bacterium]|nr:hypothetical protein [bacterium]
MKKMIATLLLVMAVFLAGSLKVSAESKTLVLPEILKPVLMTIHDNHLYVLQDTSIYIYSLKGLKLIKKFGRKGEGPKEFMARPFGPPMTMSFYEGKLAVNSNNKLSFFDPKGEYISEMKAPTNSVFYQYKDGFLAVGPAGTEDGSVRIAFRLLAKDFKQKSMFLVTDIDFG